MGPRMGSSNVLFEESGEYAAAAQAPVGAQIGGPRAGFRLRGAAQRRSAGPFLVDSRQRAVGSLAEEKGSGSFPGSDFGRPRGLTCIDPLNQRFDPLRKSLAATTLLLLSAQAQSVDVVDAGVDDKPPSPRCLRGAKSAPHPALRATFSPLCGRRETDSLIVGVRSCGVEATSPGVGVRQLRAQGDALHGW